jgi:hypothetical protein
MTSGTPHSIQHRRRVRLELEVLEARDLPSGSVFALSTPGDPPAATVVLDIRGTGMTFDQRGLPASFQGNIYIGLQPLGPVIGQYEETLTPLLLDGLFIGTLGQATFTFFPGALGDQPLATLHTFEVSFLQGVIPPIGALYVNSVGTITGTSGAVAPVQGGFTSASLLVLGPPFASNTWVDFTVQ